MSCYVKSSEAKVNTESLQIVKVHNSLEYSVGHTKLNTKPLRIVAYSATMQSIHVAPGSIYD